MNALHAGLFFALHYVSLKGLFTVTSFGDGFFWSRVTLSLFALSLLLVPVYFAKIAEQTKETSVAAGALVLANKILAGIASILVLKATDLGDVAVVQALGGLQFVFILFLGLFVPKKVGVESKRPRDILQKVLFVAVISAGFLVLFM
jgi:drug/metabolite transporter (DMT)-like permease